MNTNRILTATALALSLTWAGCNKSGKLNQPSTFTAPTGPVELKLKWPTGERIVQDMEMKQSMEVTIPGQPAPMKQDMTMGQQYGLTVLKAIPGGGHELEMDFLSARMGMTMGGKQMLDYDSAKKTAPDKANPAALPVGDMFGKIVGSKIRFYLNASNEVERVEGVDELMNRLSSGAQAESLAVLKSMFSEGYLKQMMSHNRFLPPKPVQLGDTWPVHFELPMATMGVMLLDYTFTLKKWEMHGKRNCARMEFEGTVKTKPDPNPSPAGMSISGLDGTATGVSWFDPELGMTIDTQMNQDITMLMQLPMNPGAKPGAAGGTQTITNQMSQVMSIKLASVK
jgi:hypothetical protein